MMMTGQSTSKLEHDPLRITRVLLGHTVSGFSHVTGWFLPNIGYFLLLISWARDCITRLMLCKNSRQSEVYCMFGDEDMTDMNFEELSDNKGETNLIIGLATVSISDQLTSSEFLIP